MRLIDLRAFVTLCSIVCVLTVAEAGAQRRGVPAPEKTNLPDAAVVVPLDRFVELPSIAARINGQAPLRFIVDTGAAGIVLHSKHADAMKLPSPPGMPGAVRVQMASPNGPGIPATLVYADTLTIGAAEFGGIWTIAADMPFGDGIDGIIGMNVFKSCLLTFDYPSHQLRIEHGSLPAANGRDIVAYATPDMPDSHPQVAVTIAGKDMPFIVDTGFRGWFGVEENQATALDIIDGPRPGFMSLAMDRAERSTVARVNTPFVIGDCRVERPIVRLGGQFGSIVGARFLENFIFTIDAAQHTMRFERAARTPLVPSALRSPGFELKRAGADMVVWAVYPDSPAELAGIAVGDVIVTIAGRPATQVFGAADWQDLLGRTPTLVVEYRRAGATVRKIDLQPVVLIAD